MNKIVETEIEEQIDKLQISISGENPEFDSEESPIDIEYIDEEPRNVVVGMLSQLKKGMDLHKVPFPTFVLEPRSMLERITDFVSHPRLIIK